jgi:hypothetical protein
VTVNAQGAVLSTNSTIYNADGTAVSTTTNQNGSVVTANLGVLGEVVTSNTVNSDASTLTMTAARDGSVSTVANNGAGRITTDLFAAGNVLVSSEVFVRDISDVLTLYASDGVTPMTRTAQVLNSDGTTSSTTIDAYSSAATGNAHLTTTTTQADGSDTVLTYSTGVTNSYSSTATGHKHLSSAIASGGVTTITSFANDGVTVNSIETDTYTGTVLTKKVVVAGGITTTDSYVAPSGLPSSHEVLTPGVTDTTTQFAADGATPTKLTVVSLTGSGISLITSYASDGITANLTETMQADGSYTSTVPGSGVIDAYSSTASGNAHLTTTTTQADGSGTVLTYSTGVTDRYSSSATGHELLSSATTNGGVTQQTNYSPADGTTVISTETIQADGSYIRTVPGSGVTDAYSSTATANKHLTEVTVNGDVTTTVTYASAGSGGFAVEYGTLIEEGSDTTIAQAIGPTGTVAVEVAAGFAANGINEAYDAYLTGANGVGLSAFGPTPTVGSDSGSPNGYAYDPNTGSFTVVAVGATGVASNINNGENDAGYGGVGMSGVVTNTTTGTKVYTGNGTQVAAINASNAVTGTLYANAGGLYSNPTQTGSPNGMDYSASAAVNGPVVPAGANEVPFYESASAHSIVASPLFVNSPVLDAPITVRTPTIIATLGYGGNGVAINDLGQVTGNDFTSAQSYSPSANGGEGGYSTPNTEAFETAPNGGAVTYLGMTIGTNVGVSSTATSINNAGNVGGYITLADGQTEAFISDRAHGNILDPISVPGEGSGDSTKVLFLNGSGQAIIQDVSENAYYLDNGGAEYNVASLFSPSALAGLTITGVAGFNNAGAILLDVTSATTSTKTVNADGSASINTETHYPSGADVTTTLNAATGDLTTVTTNGDTSTADTATVITDSSGSVLTASTTLGTAGASPSYSLPLPGGGFTDLSWAANGTYDAQTLNSAGHLTGSVQIGGIAANVFAFNLGDGADVIASTGAQTDQDILQMGTSLAQSTLTATELGNNLQITDGHGDSLTIAGWFQNENALSAESSSGHTTLSASYINSKLSGNGSSFTLFAPGA